MNHVQRASGTYLQAGPGRQRTDLPYLTLGKVQQSMYGTWYGMLMELGALGHISVLRAQRKDGMRERPWSRPALWDPPR